MNKSMREFVAIAGKIEKLEEEKEYHAGRMQKHKVDFDDAEKKFFECERKLAAMYKALHKYDGVHATLMK